MDASDLGLVYVSFEDHVVHIGYGSDRRAIIEIIRLNKRVTYLNGDVQDHTGNGTTDLGRTGHAGVLGYTVADNLQGTLRVILFLHGFQVVRFGKIEIFLGDNALLK